MSQGQTVETKCFFKCIVVCAESSRFGGLGGVTDSGLLIL